MDAASTIRRQVRAFGRRQFLADFATLIITALGLSAVALATALFFFKSPWFGFIGIVPLFLYRPRNPIDRAHELERRSGLEGELVNSLQLSRIPSDNRERYSTQLIDAYIESSARKARSIDAASCVSYKNLGRASFFCLTAIALGLLYPAVLPARFWFSVTRRVQYVVAPARVSFDRNTEIEMTIRFFGPYAPRAVACVCVDDRAGGERRILAVQEGIARRQVTVHRSFTYHYEFFSVRTADRRIAAAEPLYLKQLAFSLTYPPYLGMENEIKRSRSLIVPAGTRIEMNGVASRPLKSARLEYLDAVIDCSCDHDSFKTAFTASRSGTARILLSSGERSTETVEIYAIPDLAPLVDVFYPGADINMPADMIVPLGVRCSDDYRLESAVLVYQLGPEKRRPLKIKKGAAEDTILFDLDLSGSGMLPGDRLSYHVQVTDNAGNSAKSRTYIVYFPTMEQIYEDVTAQESQLRGDIREMSDQHAKDARETGRITDKLMKQRELAWGDRQQLKDIIKREETFAAKVEEWQRELERTIEQINNGIVLDQTSIERLREIARILEEIAPEDLRGALQNLEAELSKNPESIKKALAEMKAAQDEFARALERTLELLKRYQQEERFRELAEQAKELARDAAEIGDRSENQPAVDGLTSELMRKIDSLAAGIGELAGSEGLEQDISKELVSLSRQAGDISAGGRSMENAERDLNKLAADLQKLYEQLTRGRSANLRKNILETINHLIDISKMEESLSTQDNIDPDMQDQIIKAARTIADSMYAQQKKSLHVAPGTGKRIARAIKEMELAQARGNQGRAASENALEAMRQINIAVLELMESLKKGSEGGSSTGMDRLMQNLSSIAQGQMMLGQSMMGFFPLPVEGISADMMSRLRSLAARQRELRQALESMGTEPGITEQNRSLIDNMAAEMKDLEDALFQYKLDRTLIERQQVLITRLLDAQKSIRQEDFQKERRSKTGIDIMRGTPPALPGRLGIDELRERLQRALKEPYPEEYEVYIREYFKKLLEED